MAFCFFDCEDAGPVSNFDTLFVTFFFFLFWLIGFNYKEIKWDQDTVGCEYVIVNLLFVRVVFGSHCFGFIKNCLCHFM